VIYEHEETWWNDIDRRQLLIRPQELSGNPTSSRLQGVSLAIGPKVFLITFKVIDVI
jgi:hypothetical protein